jgi:FkbM family methyltransferase
MQAGTFEPEEIALVLRLLPRFDVLVDVGANVGLYTCLALQHGKQVIAFEPLPTNVSTLCRNLAANGWSTEVWPVALSDAAGIAFLYGGGTGASLVKGWAGISENWRRPIPLNTLDYILGARFADKRLFIKIDVEGSEFDVLRGAASILSRGAIWLLEITLDIHRSIPNPNFLATFELFWERGYSCFTIDGERQVTRDDVFRWTELGRVDSGTYNWLFMPES